MQERAWEQSQILEETEKNGEKKKEAKGERERRRWDHEQKIGNYALNIDEGKEKRRNWAKI